MNTKEFIKKLESLDRSCQNITTKKNKDYAGLDDVFKNFKLSEMFGVPVEKGIMVRVTDKVSRIAQLIDGRAPEVVDEKLDDTIKDAINYLKILYIYLRRND